MLDVEDEYFDLPRPFMTYENRHKRTNIQKKNQYNTNNGNMKITELNEND